MSMPSSSAFVAASPEQLARRGAPPRARGAPRAGSRRGRPPPAPGSDGSTSAQLGGAVSATCSAPRRERTKASVRTSVGDQVGEEVGGLGGGRAADRSAVLAGVATVSGGSHRASESSPRGEASSVTGSTGSPVSRSPATAGSATVAEARMKVGRRAVERADPPQPAQHVRDVRAEDAAVVVALVDDDVAQRAEEARPPLMTGEHRTVQHVGVGQDVLAEVARPVPLLPGAVTVVGHRAHVDAQLAQPGQLVLGERLGGREVEDAGAALDRVDRGASRIAVSAGSW